MRQQDHRYCLGDRIRGQARSYKGLRHAGDPGIVHHLYVNVNLQVGTVNPLVTFT